jgi:hypothetical protein
MRGIHQQGSARGEGNNLKLRFFQREAGHDKKLFLLL